MNETYGMKRGGRAGKKRPTKKVKTTIVKAKQVGKVKTGAVVQIDLSRKTVARKATNQKRASEVEKSLIPLILGIQGQQTANQSNLQRLQMERDAHAKRAFELGQQRVGHIQQGNSQAAQDAHNRQRQELRHEQRTGMEARIRGEEPIAPELPVETGTQRLGQRQLTQEEIREQRIANLKKDLSKTSLGSSRASTGPTTPQRYGEVYSPGVTPGGFGAEEQPKKKRIIKIKRPTPLSTVREGQAVAAPAPTRTASGSQTEPRTNLIRNKSVQQLRNLEVEYQNLIATGNPTTKERARKQLQRVKKSIEAIATQASAAPTPGVQPTRERR